MRRRTISLRAALGVGATVLLMGGAAVSAATPPTVKVVTSEALGAKVIVDSAGRTLYRFTPDRPKSIRCTGTCARAWPPVIVRRGTTPAAGKGILQARLGTVTRSDGRLQLTYAGLPLYRFVQDRKAGDVKGQGVGGTWFAVAPSGRLVRALPAAGSGGAPTPPPASDPTDPPGYGY